MSSPKPVVVLVPGFWEGPGVFDKVVPGLEADGLHVARTTLPSTGASGPNPPSWLDDAAAVHKIVEPFVADGKEVIIVAHSGGANISSQGIQGLTRRAQKEHGKDGGVVWMVFLAGSIFPLGFMPDLEQMSDIFDIQGDKIYCKNKDNLYHDLSEEDTAQCERTFQHQPKLDYAKEVTYTGWSDVPSTFVVTAEDRVLPVPLQEHFAGLAGSSIERCDSGHMIPLTKPDFVAQVIQKLALEVGTNP